jgi:hypothetical protein
VKRILAIGVILALLGIGCASDNDLRKNTTSDWANTGKVQSDSK